LGKRVGGFHPREKIIIIGSIVAFSVANAIFLWMVVR
jgi:hypothetical protein